MFHAEALDAPPVKPFEPDPGTTQPVPANPNPPPDKKPETPAAQPAQPAAPSSPDKPPEESKSQFKPSITLSDSKVYSGNVYLTEGAKLKYFRIDSSKIEEKELRDIKKIEFIAVRSEIIYSYRFKEAGSNEKIKDGPGYVDQEYEMEVTTTTGEKIRAHSMGQAIYVESGGQRYKFILRKHQSGEPGEPANKVIYVKKIILAP
jgi:hypothetical protein